MFSAYSFILLRTSIPGSQTDVTTMNMNATLPPHDVCTYIHVKTWIVVVLFVARGAHCSSQQNTPTNSDCDAGSLIHTYIHAYVCKHI